MSARIGLQTRVDGYLAERHRLGFELHSQDTLLADFAKFVADRHHHGPLTVELMVDWVRKGKGGLGTPETWYRRMAILRRFVRYLQQFEPQTEIPEESIFGPEPGRVAPHIYREEEIVDLLAAAHKLGPRGSFRPATFETLFGLMASTGLRVSEALHLRDADVDLKRGMLIVRQTKFAKCKRPAPPPVKRLRCGASSWFSRGGRDGQGRGTGGALATACGRVAGERRHSEGVL